MMSIFCLIKEFYTKNRNFINYNKNLVISAIITAIVDIVIVTLSALTFIENYLLISSISLVADFITFNSIFVILLYRDNIIKKERLRQDSMKFLTTLGVAEISYLITKFLTTYLFFQLIKFDSAQISISTTALAWICYIVISNILAKRTKILT
ncbi:hypothetical protein [Candidatus Nitrosocosmicus franklandus]|uniref:GtrA-like protein n=1 Tax=Candidatus Nitrosocosmicus franklandianus TaxID=1798806 RepID=A0A484IAH7_9ARCH|nr:hypothetical protein [Candidatus Nitrosocosmicus franklandus]VFJ13832.1 membrane protein of unknown function [Candidatus Nitrosocosmicus franklandus]